MTQLKTFAFIVDVDAVTDAGKQTVRNFRVAVESVDRGNARDDLKAVAFEALSDAGSDKLDGNLIEITLSNVRKA